MKLCREKATAQVLLRRPSLWILGSGLPIEGEITLAVDFLANNSPPDHALDGLNDQSRVNHLITRDMLRLFETMNVLPLVHYASSSEICHERKGGILSNFFHEIPRHIAVESSAVERDYYRSITLTDTT